MKALVRCLSTVSTQFQRIKFNSFTSSIAQFATTKTCMKITTYQLRQGLPWQLWLPMRLVHIQSYPCNLYQSSWLSTRCMEITLFSSHHTRRTCWSARIYYFFNVLYMCFAFNVVSSGRISLRYKPKCCLILGPSHWSKGSLTADCSHLNFMLMWKEL